MIDGIDHLLITSIEKEMSRKKYLALLVDGDAKEPLDPRKMGFPKEELAGVVVCITKKSSKKANSELTMAQDLNINTEDHLLPWEVFCRNIGTPILESSFAKRLMAVRIVEECGGHLLAGVIVAKSLRNANYVEDWERALHKLCSLHPSHDVGMFQDQSSVMLKAFINFIWHDLSKTQKYCLTSCLFISKFGKPKDELIYDWISSRIMVAGEADHNLREFVDRFALLRLQDNKSRYIQIPQDTYAILQVLNTQNPLFMTKSEFSVRELPNSFFELEQLREPYMKGCERFMKLSSEVGKLKNLEKLDLDKTQIIHLPQEIRELTNLQSLILCFYEYCGKKSMQYTSSTIIPSGVISKLRGLKHLSIDVNPDDERRQENLQVILPEVLVLECLQTVNLYIPELELLNLIPARIFKLDFRFIVGKHVTDHFKHTTHS
ncbi:probable disease resistance protein At1g15890 [Prosopis cineraria]|uniref:probable disease resistance protein At1g15890 n=1 Tax=Prosopis cineraria TaxID=364024 RepID=UPI00240F827B|nr:probable disease resistance protein At1g15890 [Prosopis cineraria]